MRPCRSGWFGANTSRRPARAPPRETPAPSRQAPRNRSTRRCRAATHRPARTGRLFAHTTLGPAEGCGRTRGGAVPRRACRTATASAPRERQPGAGGGPLLRLPGGESGLSVLLVRATGHRRPSDKRTQQPEPLRCLWPLKVEHAACGASPSVIGQLERTSPDMSNPTAPGPAHHTSVPPPVISRRAASTRRRSFGRGSPSSLLSSGTAAAAPGPITPRACTATLRISGL